MTPEMFRKLASLGLSHEQMAGVLEIFEDDAESRKAKARARVQKWRDKNKGETLRNVTGHNETLRNATVGLTRAVDKSSSSEIKEGKKALRAASPTTPPAKGTRLPSEWAPDFDALAFSQSDSETTGNPPLTAGEIERELARFRDYWPGQPGQKGVKTDWQGTFRNWLRKAADDKQNRKSAYAPRAGAADKMADAFSNLRAKAAGSADAGPGDFSGGGPFRLIPGSRGS